MAALTKDRDTRRRDGQRFDLPVAAATRIFAGSLVVLDAGTAKPGSAALSLRAVGMAEETVDNSAGAAGDLSVPVIRGVYAFANSAAADEITAADLFAPCHIVDDQTVARTDGSGTRSTAGIVLGVDSNGIWVAVGVAELPADAKAARASLGVNKVFLQLAAADLVAANAAVTRVVAPIAGTITKIRSVISGALAAGDTTLTAKIGAAAVTNGVVTITQAGSAAGDVDSATPTAANVVAAGDVVSLTVGGANTDATASAAVIVEITY